jgi:hypothetical protein
MSHRTEISINRVYDFGQRIKVIEPAIGFIVEFHRVPDEIVGGQVNSLNRVLLALLDLANNRCQKQRFNNFVVNNVVGLRKVTGKTVVLQEEVVAEVDEV